MGTNSALIKQINRTTSVQTLKVVLIANIVLALIYYKTLYVRQASIDTTKLDSMLMNKGERLCMSGATDAYQALGLPKECTAQCLCFRLEQGEEGMKR